MENRLLGKTILITGASAGIGRSTAVQFAKACPRDLKLVLTARRVDRLKECADDIDRIAGKGVKVLCSKLDISDLKDIQSFISNLPAEFQDIDILVNNA
jgi:3-hydroxy acid dehydrogenase / malonic semialdehyde reductase